VQIRASCWSVQERNRRRFWTFSLPVLSNIAAAVSDEARGFKVGLRGGYGRGIPPAGGPGAQPPEKFSSYRCMQVSFSAFFRQKSTH
jgi:hypothetical protein